MARPKLSWWLGITRGHIQRQLINSISTQSLLRTQRISRQCFLNWAAREYIGLLPNLGDIVAYMPIDKLHSRIVGTDLQRLRKQIFARDNYICAYCGKRGGSLELDHILPLSRGGTDDDSNLTTACVKCNRQKRTKTANEYFIWRSQNG